MATPANSARCWRFGLFEVDAQKEEVRRGGVPVKMREQPFRILVLLLEHAGETALCTWCPRSGVRSGGSQLPDARLMPHPGWPGLRMGHES